MGKLYIYLLMTYYNDPSEVYHRFRTPYSSECKPFHNLLD